MAILLAAPHARRAQTGHKSRNFLSSILILWPAPHITACSASPKAPLSGFQLNLPSLFMCLMAGYMALHRFIIAFIALVTRR